MCITRVNGFCLFGVVFHRSIVLNSATERKYSGTTIEMFDEVTSILGKQPFEYRYQEEVETSWRQAALSLTDTDIGNFYDLSFSLTHTPIF